MTIPKYAGPVLKVDQGPQFYIHRRDKHTSAEIRLGLKEAPRLLKELRNWYLKEMAVKEVNIQGITVKIDRPKGFIQEGEDAEGNSWSREYKVDYGYIQKTEGGDNEPLDVYCGLHPASLQTYWIYQTRSDGSFDEYKVMMGFDSPDVAKQCYLDHTPSQYFGKMYAVPIAAMKALLGLSPLYLQKALDEYEKGDMSAPAPGEAGSKEPDPQVIAKPFAGYKDFDTCVADQKKAGHSEDSARRICGSLQARTEKQNFTHPWLQKNVSKDVKLLKTEEERFVYGIILVPDEVDLQGDIYSEEEVRSACHEYMAAHRNMGDQHKEIITEGQSFSVLDPVVILECYVAPIAFEMSGVMIKKGTWIMGCRINDEDMWTAIKENRKTGFSIGGSAMRSPEN